MNETTRQTLATAIMNVDGIRDHLLDRFNAIEALFDAVGDAAARSADIAPHARELCFHGRALCTEAREAVSRDTQYGPEHV